MVVLKPDQRTVVFIQLGFGCDLFCEQLTDRDHSLFPRHVGLAVDAGRVRVAPRSVMQEPQKRIADDVVVAMQRSP